MWESQKLHKIKRNRANFGDMKTIFPKLQYGGHNKVELVVKNQQQKKENTIKKSTSGQLLKTK